MPETADQLLEKYTGKDDNDIPLFVVAIRWAKDTGREIPEIYADEVEHFFTEEFLKLYADWHEYAFSDFKESL